MLLQTGPLAVALLIGPRLENMIAAVVVTRLLMLVPLAWAAFAAARPFPRLHLEGVWLKRLLGFGGWVTLSDLVTPVMDFLDRFAIASLLGPVAVTNYVVPFNLASRTRILPVSVTRALFPRLSALGPDEARRLGVQTLRRLALLLTPVFLIGLLLVAPFLRWWIGTDFAHGAAPLGQILLVGAWSAGLAQIGFVTLQAEGRPSRVAWIRCGEIPFFLGVLWWGLVHFGVRGAAYAWTGWSLLDASLLLGTSGLLDPRTSAGLLTGLTLLLLESWLVGLHTPLAFPLLIAAAVTLTALVLGHREIRRALSAFGGAR